MDNNTRKVGVITLHGYYNYGNRLQNYAVQEVIKELGFNVETVVIKNMPSKNNTINKIINKISKVFRMPFKEIYKKVYNKIGKKINHYINKNSIDERTKIFKDFSKKYLSEKYYYNSNNALEGLSNEYDFFITGSDQVWNPLYINKSPIYFLTFAKQNKRISYAPSFGRTDIPEEHKENFRVWLSEMKTLSVREEAGAKIIKELTGRDATVLIDPTLMLSKEKWLSVSKESLSKPKGKYILTYFLGGISKENELHIREIANNYNMQLINLVDLKDKERYKTGPSEFLDYINSASLFFTDSFHGVVFSILMETPFVVYERISKSASMYSRIETLLNTFNLRSREACNIKNNEQLFNMDFSHINPILELERKKAMDYLKEALNVENEVKNGN